MSLIIIVLIVVTYHVRRNRITSFGCRELPARVMYGIASSWHDLTGTHARAQADVTVRPTLLHMLFSLVMDVCDVLMLAQGKSMHNHLAW